MKTTFKISALALAFAAFSFGANAQSKTSTTTDSGIKLSIGVDAGVPVGNYNDFYNWNLGGSVQADIPVAKQVFVTVNAGYNNIFGKDIANTSAHYTNIQLIPVKAGLKYFPIENFYVQGEAGAAFVANKSDLGVSKTALFAYAPQVGVQFPVSGKSFIDAGVRFEGNSPLVTNGKNLNFIGLRLAYGFGL
ncbi:MAG: hypothetical protein ABIN91_09120 [Mucilaginibacter sp.]|uniref:hypothetical protein n=1 Tax=Mucilaginibacter sp. TaxID=1882438 RepID=UPI003265EFE3